MRFILFLPALLCIALWWFQPDKTKEVGATAFGQDFTAGITMGSLSLATYKGYRGFRAPYAKTEYTLDPKLYPDSQITPITNLIGVLYPRAMSPGSTKLLLIPMWLCSAGLIAAPAFYLWRRAKKKTTRGADSPQTADSSGSENL